MQGLKKTPSMHVKCIEVLRDCQIVARQVRNSINCTSNHLKNYLARGMRNLLINLKILILNPYLILWIRKQTCWLMQLPIFVRMMISLMTIFLFYRPLIPDNITNWRVFEDNEQIHLRDHVIDDEQHESLLQASIWEEKAERSNKMPKNIVRLEKLFDLQDKFRRPTNTNTNNSSLLYEVVNLST